MQFPGFGDDGTDDEGAENHAVFEFDHQQAETEAQAQYCYQQHLVAPEFADIGQQAGNEQYADEHGHNHEQRQFRNRQENVTAANAAGNGNPGEQGDQSDTQNILDNKHAENQLGEPFVFHFQIV